MNRLEDKVAIITGGAKGIGKETARKFSQEGAIVIIADLDEKEGVNTLRELGLKEDKGSFIQVNVTNSEEVVHMAKHAKEKFGKVDILVNNAGITIDGFLTKMEKSQWDKVIQVNLTGVFNCVKSVVPTMMEQGSGVILNASSVIGIYGNIGQTNYAATKAGVIGLTKSWAKEFGPKGIRVNALAPGFIKTDMTAKVPQKVLDQMESKTSLKYLGMPEDIANSYCFLASDEARYITGTILSVDGGLVV